MVETRAWERPNGQTHRVERVSGMPPQRNRYTRLVETYWREYYPEQVAEMEDPEAFFCQQADELADRVTELEQVLAEADPVPEDEGYLARVGRLTSERMRAEEMAIAELLPTPANDEELAEANKAPRRSLGEDESRPKRVAERPGVQPLAAPAAVDVAVSEQVPAARFRPGGQEDLAPSGAVARVRANLAAVRLLRELETQDRSATADEQAVLARWSGWGAVPGVFDEETEAGVSNGLCERLVLTKGP